MCRELNDLQALLIKYCPYAYYVHYLTYQLHLASITFGSLYCS
jgi:hypothetical protein